MSGVRRIKLGTQGLEVSAIGLGCMGMSGGYGPAKPEEEMIKLIHHAINSGVTHLDTNEILIGKALKGVKREEVEVATKFGIKFWVGHDVDYIDLYYVHRIDTKVPIEITIKKLVEEGKIKHIGLSEAGPATIRRAHAVHPITAVQLEWSLWTRDAEEEVIPTCRELGIGIVPFGPLGSGFFASGPKVMENLANNDYRKLALAWLLHQGDDVGPIPGTTKIENLNQNLEALAVKLTAQDMAEVEFMASFKGARMPEQILVHTYKNSDTPPLSSRKSDYASRTMGELKKLVEEGKVKYVGLSEAGASTIRRTHVVHPITVVQNEWSLQSRDLEDELLAIIV
ncbi:hypothetical protein L1987_10591 [Smallanthus sonchifolius]|uniref:Uncharacterized protein n=1 Tax=Smallanthus sonchifolius TaxID=185202 RepID=A0ACB9JSH8_9ASTR|nr:hypothetical protein L1987_10591 [Smallanthus sonchifolius]